jgi:hypothetical protein
LSYPTKGVMQLKKLHITFLITYNIFSYIRQLQKTKFFFSVSYFILSFIYLFIYLLKNFKLFHLMIFLVILGYVTLS